MPIFVYGTGGRFRFLRHDPGEMPEFLFGGWHPTLQAAREAAITRHAGAAHVAWRPASAEQRALALPMVDFPPLRDPAAMAVWHPMTPEEAAAIEVWEMIVQPA